MKSWKYNNPEFECDKLNYDLLKFAPWSGHRNFVYDFMAFFKPKTVAELGSHYGCSAFTFAQAAKDFELDTEMYFVDTWQGDDFTNKYDNDVYSVFSKTVESFYSSQNINMLRMTFNEAVEKFEDKSIELLHIDGSHHYDDVKEDFENWIDKVSNNGIIMLHDVSSDIVLGDVMGSYKFWQELKEKYKYTAEFDFSWGLGIIFLDKEKYKAFKSEVDIKKYQRINNALDVEFKDQLRKNYFTIKDRDIYIDSLLEQKKVLNEHIDNYKKDMDNIKTAWKKDTDEIKVSYEKTIDEIKVSYEKTIDEIKTQNEKAFNDAVSNYEKDKAEMIGAYEEDKKQVIAAYEAEKSNIVNAYEEKIKEVAESYAETTRGKDKYIAELEEIKKEKEALEKAYYNTINYKFTEMKRKFKK